MAGSLATYETAIHILRTYIICGRIKIIMGVLWGRKKRANLGQAVMNRRMQPRIRGANMRRGARKLYDSDYEIEFIFI